MKSTFNRTAPIDKHYDDYRHQYIAPLVKKASQKSMRTFNPKNILPIDHSIAGPSPRVPSPPFNKGTNAPLPPIPSSATTPELEESADEMRGAPNGRNHEYIPSPPEQALNFDLAPPPPNAAITTTDGLSEPLFSDDHLRTILRDPLLFAKFSSFINRYKPRLAPILNRYLETQKAIIAVEYANAVADAMPAITSDQSSSIPCAAALLEGRFEARSKRAFDSLANEALPAFITHSMVQVVTDSMVREITGTTVPIMRDLVAGLAEVFCLTDCNIEDNPIVYASEEFYKTTQYGRDYVIGRNCRFLQGPRSDRRTIARISAAVQAGEECNEVLLNYRRDGTPFFNLLLCAPLYDNRGKVRYFIGAQIDITGLVEDGRGVESFEKYLIERKQKEAIENEEDPQEDITSSPLKTLSELGKLLSPEEVAIVQSGKEKDNTMRDDASMGSNGRRDNQSRAGRRIIGVERHDQDMGSDRSAYVGSSLRMSGRLPGVYQNYFLLRPFPSLRIIFVSPSLRIPGLLQSHFLTRIGGSTHIRDSLTDAFASGTAVTAQVTWLSGGRSNSDDEDGASDNGSGRLTGVEGNRKRLRWISCTPLFGSDDRVGVWMVVMIDPERGAGAPMYSHGPSIQHSHTHSTNTDRSNSLRGILPQREPDRKPSTQRFAPQGHGQGDYFSNSMNIQTLRGQSQAQAQQHHQQQQQSQQRLGEDEGIALDDLHSPISSTTIKQHNHHQYQQQAEQQQQSQKAQPFFFEDYSQMSRSPPGAASTSAHAESHRDRSTSSKTGANPRNNSFSRPSGESNRTAVNLNGTSNDNSNSNSISNANGTLTNPNTTNGSYISAPRPNGPSQSKSYKLERRNSYNKTTQHARHKNLFDGRNIPGSPSRDGFHANANANTNANANASANGRDVSPFPKRDGSLQGTLVGAHTLLQTTPVGKGGKYGGAMDDDHDGEERWVSPVEED